MFRKPKNETFWAKVKTSATDEDGRRVNGEFEIQCKRVPISQLKAMHKAHEEDDLPDAGFLSEVVVGWRGVWQDESDAPLDFTPDNLRALCDAGFSLPMVTGFYDAMSGARAKN